MSRTPLPLQVGDIAALARSLGERMHESEKPLGHVQILNVLAKSAGFRNFQHLKARHEADAAQNRPVPAPEPVDAARLVRLVRHFDAEGRLMRWPGKAGLRPACLWVMWSKIPAGQALDEPAVNRVLSQNHLFGDPALLRRDLVDAGLMTRTPDCREYRRVERRPSAEALALLERLSARVRGE